MCTSPVQPICTFSCTAHFISLHILPLILFHYLFLTSFSPYLYIYILSRVLFHSFYCFYVIFILLSCFIFLSCTFHWADLSWLTFHYLLYPVWLCMWQIIKNLEPWTLKQAWLGLCRKIHNIHMHASSTSNYLQLYIHSISQKWLLPSHFSKTFSIISQGTMLHKWNLDIF